MMNHPGNYFYVVFFSIILLFSLVVKNNKYNLSLLFAHIVFPDFNSNNMLNC